MKFRRKSRTNTWLIMVLLVVILIVGLIAGFKLNSL
ncbi:phosphoribosylglycinamide synthetase, partial [Leuconostoc mesenteroides]|nr:phosphoribosylglycinamide synthetase [Leuconostoc mesenteroides]MCT3044811.1 phosphoribosylglycinamide synthetase [Leuconostoc mesenteroides]